MSNLRTIGTYSVPRNFGIRTKQDAKRFLSEMIEENSCFAIRDIHLPNKYQYIVYRGTSSDTARIAYEPITSSMAKPKFLYCGQPAVDMAYKGRKSVCICN